MVRITHTSGNILQADVEAIVNAVNCCGVAGKGLALQFKASFPHNFEAYSIACRNGEVSPGKMFVFDTRSLTNPRYIINFPTKRHWRDKSRLDDIESGLRALAGIIHHYHIRSVAIPALGCGLGGLGWSEVLPCIAEAVRDLSNVNVIIYEPL